MPGSSVLRYLQEFDHIHVHQVGDAIQSSHPLPLPSLLPSVIPSIRVFPVSRLFTSSGQRIGSSASVLPVNIQG